MDPEEDTAQATASTLRPAPAEQDTALDPSGGPQPSAKASLPRGTPIGRFIVIDSLGAGAMGEVVLAYDPDLHRRVAVKVLRTGLMAQGDAAVQRMLREARAMAKLSHPNVITVFEVDQMDSGRSFIAMEFVDGGTLRAWGRQGHGWRAVVEVYAAAGAGLAAAHTQGLVHRDFKPDNVLIDKDGRVRVTDFGLVGAVDDEPTLVEAGSLTISSSGSRTAEFGPTDATLTRTGSLLGTPAYMAPEEGKAIDARSDQFSFCVALYEALCGERPFGGDSLMELRSNVCNGRRRPFPPDADVPRWLRDVVERGLATAPDQRWPDMHALLRALQHDPSRQRRRLAYGVAGLGVVGTAVAFAVGGAEAPAEPSCDRGESKTAAVWNETRSDAMRDAFASADAESAAAGFGAVETAMDGFVSAWQDGHFDACQAHQIRGDQSAAMFDRRMLCLQRRLERTDALLGAFEQPDAGAVAAASNIEGALPSVDTCADVEALQSMVPPPDAPDVRTEWKRLQLGIDRADALGIAGKQLEALDAYAELREGIETVDHPPLSARYLQNYANALIRVEKYTEAIDVLAGAPEAAARSDDPRIEANVWLLLARAHGFGLGDAKAGAWAARAAEVAAVRATDQAMMQLNIQFTQSILAESAGDYPLAVAAARRAVASAEEVFGHAHRNTSAAWGTLGNALHRLGKRDEAREAHETSLAIDRGLHDDPHPDVAASLINLGLLDEDEGEYEAARVRYVEALEIYEQSVGPEHGAYGTVLLNLASNAAQREDYPGARARYQQVLDVYAKTVPEGHADYATIYTGLAEIAMAQGQLDEAVSEATRALDIRVAALGKDHPKVMLARTTLGRVRLARGEHGQAETELREAKRIAQETLEPDHLDHVDILIALGEVLVQTDRAAEATPLLERAVGLAKDAPAAKRERAEAALRAATPGSSPR